MLVEILLFIAVSLAIAYLVLMFMGTAPSYQGDSALYELSSTSTTVLPYKFCPWDGRPSSIRFAVFIQQAPKTIAKVDACVTQSTRITEFGPSCSDYTFQKCACNGGNCDGCAVKTNYLSKLVSIGDSLQLWASGYTSTNDMPYVPALLAIKTAQDSTNYFMESVSLPAIPLQRWTVITIVKEGRRFDVYYGEKLVASKLCDNIPLGPPGGADWKAGGLVGWKGKIGLFTGFAKAESQDDVNADVSALVNTRGVPFYLDQINFNFNLQMPQCMFGNCNNLPAVKPLNPFAVYTSNVQ